MMFVALLLLVVCTNANINVSEPIFPECTALGVSLCDFSYLLDPFANGPGPIQSFAVFTTFVQTGGAIPFDAVVVAGSPTHGPVGQTTNCNTYVSGGISPVDHDPTLSNNNVLSTNANFMQAQGGSVTWILKPAVKEVTCFPLLMI
jgi:hypothetical protein